MPKSRVEQKKRQKKRSQGAEQDPAGERLPQDRQAFNQVLLRSRRNQVMGALQENRENLSQAISLSPDTVRDPEGRMLYGFGRMHDITEEKAAERALHRRDEILNALAQYTKRFLEAPSHQKPIKEMLGRLGDATGVSRVYVFENQINDQGVLVTSERQEWVAPGVKSHAENLDTQNFPWVARGMERWARALSRGEAIQGLREDFPASEQWLLVVQDIRSILIVPIFVEQQWWGFIGFDDCESQRLWSAAETDALTVAAGGLGALIQRSQAEERLRQHALELKERVKEINCLLSISSLAESPELSGDVFQGIVDLIPPAWQFPEITCARIAVEGEEYRTANFRETIRRQSSDIRLFGQQVGTVEVCYLSEDPKVNQLPFLREETELLNAVATILARLIERKRSKQRILSLSQELVRVRESERQKISQDLHDHLAQDLASIKLGLKNLIGDLTHLSDAQRQKADVLSQLIEQSVAFIRKMTYELHPHGLKDLGLVETIRLYCEEFAAGTGTKVEFFSAGMRPIDLGFDGEISLYRIVQEGLSNIQKHAAASHVIIRLSASFPFIMLQIEDNGKGFDVERRMEDALKKRRMGLRIMEQRVALLKGKIVIVSRVGSGCRIRIRIPYREGSNG